MRHSLNFHDALKLALMGEPVKLDRQEFQLGFLPSPIPVEVPGNEESLVRLLRQSPCCRENDRALLSLRFDKVGKCHLVENLRIDWCADLRVDDLDRFSHNTINSAFCLS